MSRSPSQWQFFADLRKNGCKDLRFNAGTLSSQHPNISKLSQGITSQQIVQSFPLAIILLLFSTFGVFLHRPFLRCFFWGPSEANETPLSSINTVTWESCWFCAESMLPYPPIITYPPIQAPSWILNKKVGQIDCWHSKFRAKPYDRNEDSGHFSLGKALFSEEKVKNPLDRVLQFNFSPHTWGRSNSGDLRVCVRAKPWDRQENKDLIDVRPQQMSSTSCTNEKEFMPDWATEGRAEKTSTPKTRQFVGVYVVICSV